MATPPPSTSKKLQIRIRNQTYVCFTCQYESKDRNAFMSHLWNGHLKSVGKSTHKQYGCTHESSDLTEPEQCGVVQKLISSLDQRMQAAQNRARLERESQEQMNNASNPSCGNSTGQSESTVPAENNQDSETAEQEKPINQRDLTASPKASGSSSKQHASSCKSDLDNSISSMDETQSDKLNGGTETESDRPCEENKDQTDNDTHFQVNQGAEPSSQSMQPNKDEFDGGIDTDEKEQVNKEAKDKDIQSEGQNLGLMISGTCSLQSDKKDEQDTEKQEQNQVAIQNLMSEWSVDSDKQSAPGKKQKQTDEQNQTEYAHNQNSSTQAPAQNNNNFQSHSAPSTFNLQNNFEFRKFYLCAFKGCQYQSNESVDFFQHTQLHNSSNNLCIYCRMSFRSGKELLHHIDKQHGFKKNVQPFHCAFKECKYYFSQADSFLDHCQIAHETERRFPCHYCRSTFQSGQNLTQHLQAHKLKQIECSYCDMKSENRRAIQRHIGQVHPMEARKISVSCLIMCQLWNIARENKHFLDNLPDIENDQSVMDGQTVNKPYAKSPDNLRRDSTNDRMIEAPHLMGSVGEDQLVIKSEPHSPIPEEIEEEIPMDTSVDLLTVKPPLQIPQVTSSLEGNINKNFIPLACETSLIDAPFQSSSTSPDKRAKKEYRCAQCQYFSQYCSQDVKKHYMTRHLHQHPFSCWYCNFIGFDRPRIMKHQAEAHIGLPEKLIRHNISFVVKAVSKSPEKNVYMVGTDNDEAIQKIYQDESMDLSSPKMDLSQESDSDPQGEHVYKCAFCKFENKEKELVQMHQQSHFHVEPKQPKQPQPPRNSAQHKPYRCQFCTHRTYTKQGIIRHLRYKHPSKPEKFKVLKKPVILAVPNLKRRFSEEPEGVPVQKKLNIEPMDASPNTSVEFASSPASVSKGRTFHCKMCGFESAVRQQVFSHICYKHFKQRKVMCGYCRGKFRDDYALKIHTNRLHKGLPHNSVRMKPLTEAVRKRIDDNIYVVRSELTTPNKNESTPTKTLIKMPFFKSPTTVKPEVQSNLPQRRESDTSSTQKPKAKNIEYQCTYCNYVAPKKRGASNRVAMRTHLKTHLKYKPFKCNFCSYVSSSLGHVKRHQYAVHDGNDSPPQYEKDDAKESQLSEILKKCIVTTPVRTGIFYKCVLCPFYSGVKYQCHQLRNLTYHITATHLHYKPYKCVYCKLDGVDKMAITRHQKNVHRAKPVRVAIVKNLKMEKQLNELIEQSTIMPSSQNLNTKASSSSETEETFSTPVKSEKVPQATSSPKLKWGEKDLGFVYYCSICDYHTSGKTNKHIQYSTLEYHMKGHLKYTPYHCNHCTYKGRNRHDIMKHHKRMHTGQPVDFTLKKVASLEQELGKRCSECYFTSDATTSDVTTDASNAEESVTLENDSASTFSLTFKFYQCPKCDFHTKAGQVRTSSMAYHLRSHYNYKPFKCSYCDIEGHYVSSMRMHWTSKHCDQPFNYEDRTDLGIEAKIKEEVENSRVYYTGKSRHRSVDTSDGKELTTAKKIQKVSSSPLATPKRDVPVDGNVHYKCNQCSFHSPAVSTKTNQYRSFKNHVMNHLQYRPYHCTRCSYKSYERGCTVRHMRNVHGPKSGSERYVRDEELETHVSKWISECFISEDQPSHYEEHLRNIKSLSDAEKMLDGSGIKKEMQTDYIDSREGHDKLRMGNEILQTYGIKTEPVEHDEHVPNFHAQLGLVPVVGTGSWEVAEPLQQTNEQHKVPALRHSGKIKRLNQCIDRLKEIGNIAAKSSDKEEEDTAVLKETLKFKCVRCKFTCNKLKNSRYQMYHHVRTHFKLKPYTCFHCKFSCQQFKRLKLHQRKYHSSKPLRQRSSKKETKTQQRTLQKKANKFMTKCQRVKKIEEIPEEKTVISSAVGDTPLDSCSTSPYKYGAKKKKVSIVAVFDSPNRRITRLCKDEDEDKSEDKKESQVQESPSRTPRMKWKHYLSPYSIGKKGYKCWECPYKTFNIHHLKGHLFVHLKYQPFRCGGCGYKSSQRGHAKDHCEKCGGTGSEYVEVRDPDIEMKINNYLASQQGKPVQEIDKQTSAVLGKSSNDENTTSIEKGLSAEQIKQEITDVTDTEMTPTVTTPGPVKEEPKVVDKTSEPEQGRTEDSNETTKLHKPASDSVNNTRAKATTRTKQKFMCCNKCNYKCSLALHMKTHLYFHAQYRPFHCRKCDHKASRYTRIRKHCLISHGRVCIVRKRDQAFEKEVADFIKTQEHICSTPKFEDAPNPHMLKSEKAASTSQSKRLSRLSQIKNWKKANPFVTTKRKRIHHSPKKTGVFTCNECNFTTLYIRHLQNHLFGHMRYQPFRCGHCGHGAVKKWNVVAHCRRQHSGKIKIKEERDPSVERGVMEYVETQLHGTNAESKEDLQKVGEPSQEVEKHTDKNAKETHQSESQMETNKQNEEQVETDDKGTCYTDQSNVKTEIGEGSSETFTEKDGVQQVTPTTENDPKRRYHCYICEYRSHDSSGLRNHLYFHMKYKPFHCGTCGYQAIQKHHMKRHFRGRHKGKIIENKDEEIEKKVNDYLATQPVREDVKPDISQSDTDTVEDIARPVKSDVDTLNKPSKDVQIKKEPILQKEEKPSDKKGKKKVSRKPKEKAVIHLRRWKCNTCSFATDHRSLLYLHKAKQHPQKSGFTCKYCKKFTFTESGMKQHFKEKHPGRKESFKTSYKEARAITKKWAEKIPCKKYCCLYCELRADSRQFLRQHLLTHYNYKRFQCKKCCNMFSRSNDVKRHSIRTHKKDYGVSVVLDDAMEKRAELDFAKVMKNTHGGIIPKFGSQKNSSGGKKIKLKIKPKDRDKRKRAKKIVPKIHVFEMNIPCITCNEIFHSVIKLQAHIRSHHDYHPFKCRYCNHRGFYTFDMKKHWAAEHPKKPYRFSTEKDPVLDDRVEEDVEKSMALVPKEIKTEVDETPDGPVKPKPIKTPRASQCGKLFPHKHIWCDRCDYATDRQDSIRRHIENHLKYRPFKCSQCSFASNIRGTTTKHVQGTHPTAQVLTVRDPEMEKKIQAKKKRLMSDGAKKRLSLGVEAPPAGENLQDVKNPE